MKEHLVAANLAMTMPSAASKYLGRAIPDEADPPRSATSSARPRKARHVRRPRRQSRGGRPFMSPTIAWLSRCAWIANAISGPSAWGRGAAGAARRCCSGRWTPTLRRAPRTAPACGATPPAEHGRLRSSGRVVRRPKGAGNRSGSPWGGSIRSVQAPARRFRRIPRPRSLRPRPHRSERHCARAPRSGAAGRQCPAPTA
jgi:hypothetical protein